MGSPALGQGSNCKLQGVLALGRIESTGRDVQCILQVLINLHDGSLIATPVAVVGRCKS